ncbi:MAG: thioredoxin family protein [Saprospiraceae bacterium]|nr:thioredoxin family protein [Saprospiraceae bacterium]
MNKFVATALFAISIPVFALAQGINFFHGTWPEAMAQAKTEQKLIFVDAYASWCGPCKRMAANVFPDPQVGDYFNANFVNLKIDMEKPENSEFAGKYPVSAYPTLLILDAEGKIVHKHVGGLAADGLIAFGQKAAGKTDTSKDFEKEYNAGNRDPQLVLDYVRALNRANKPSLKITNEYLNAQKDLHTPINHKIILEGAVEADSRVFDLLLTHRDKIAAQEGKDAVDTRINLACQNTLKKAIEFRDERLLLEAKNKLKAGLPARADDFIAEADMKYYAATKDVKNYLKSAQAFQKKSVRNNAAKLHDLVIGLMRAFPTDKSALEQAEKWAKNAADNGGLGEYYLTLAEVYKRLGDKPKARAAAEKARNAGGEKESGSMASKVDYFLQTLEN